MLPCGKNIKKLVKCDVERKEKRKKGNTLEYRIKIRDIGIN
jgi:hypothetical protein